jgi:hypothetical protein
MSDVVVSTEVHAGSSFMAGLAVSRDVAEICGFLEQSRIDLWRIRQNGSNKAFRNSSGAKNNEYRREDARSEERL